MGYYFLTVAIGWLDRRPELRPDLLLWLPNLLFVGVGLWMFWRVDKALARLRGDHAGPSVDGRQHLVGATGMDAWVCQ